MPRVLAGVVVLCAVVASACAPVYWIAMRLYYDKVEIPAGRVAMNVGYDASAPGDHKRQLDLFLPEGRDWPTVVFVHGGGWAWGDRAQKFGGEDIYRNIGRFLAREGFAGVVPSYRLIWKVDWRTQVADVARAVAWVQRNIGARGGNPRQLFLMGHSAGAQLAMRVAVDPRWLEAAGGSARDICGVVTVSIAGYDMEDKVTERFDADKSYYVQRFGGSVKENADDNGAVSAWRREASVRPSLDKTDPPFLMLIGDRDYPSVQHQARLAEEFMRTLGISRGFLIVPSADHERIVLELSRADHVAGPAILKFLRDAPCPRS